MSFSKEKERSLLGICIGLGEHSGILVSKWGRWGCQ